MGCNIIVNCYHYRRNSINAFYEFFLDKPHIRNKSRPVCSYVHYCMERCTNCSTHSGQPGCATQRLCNFMVDNTCSLFNSECRICIAGIKNKPFGNSICFITLSQKNKIEKPFFVIVLVQCNICYHTRRHIWFYVDRALQLSRWALHDHHHHYDNWLHRSKTSFSNG